jgi:hypothetical protein
VYLLDGLGRESGVDLERLIDADVSLREWLGRPLPGRVAETELNRRPAPGQIP